MHIFKYDQIKKFSVRGWGLFYVLLGQLGDLVFETETCVLGSVQTQKGKKQSVLSRACKPNVTPNEAPGYSHAQVKKQGVTRKHAQLMPQAAFTGQQQPACFCKHLFKGGLKIKMEIAK